MTDLDTPNDVTGGEPEAGQLRREAEEKIGAKMGETIEGLSPEEAGRMFHELQVHQIELELQNEELRRMQQALEESRARYFDLYNLAPVGYFTVSELGLIQESNLTAATMLGIARSALVKQPLTRFILPVDQDHYYIHRRHLFDTGVPQVCELRLMRSTPPGALFWARLEATVDHGRAGEEPVCRVVISDITERKQAEETLRLFKTVVESSNEAIAISDAQGRLVYINAAHERLFGRSLAEAQGLNYRDFYPPESIEVLDQQVTPLLKRGKSWEGELEAFDAAGRKFPLWERADSIRDADGKLLYGFGLMHDITARKQAEAERAKLEARTRQVEKADSLNRMAGAIAHHFNNQLQAVMGYLEMAQITRVPPSPEIARDLSQAMIAARRAAEVSRLMLTYLGQTTDQREPLDLAEVCARNLPILRAAIPKDVTLEADLPTPGPVISASANQLQQLLTNLVTNSWEAIAGEPGHIRLTVSTVAAADIPVTNRFPLDWQPQEQVYACLQVADTGGGIAGPDIEKLFDPFFSTKFTGRGLGLAVVLGIVRASAGAVTVLSEPGRGSFFRLFFPMVAPQAILPPDQPAQISVRSDGDTVLLVEDEESVREIVAEMLDHLGYPVLAARDGAEAVEMFRQHRAEIRCVLCDLSMPRMDGWATLTALRQLAPNLPVILASGYSEAHVMAGNHPERPQAFLSKPCQLQALQDVMDRVLVEKNVTEASD